MSASHRLRSLPRWRVDGPPEEVAVRAETTASVHRSLQADFCAPGGRRARVPVGFSPDILEGLVLVVDDEPHLRDSLAWLLEPQPVVTAETLDIARAYLEHEPVRFVLCDLQLPTGLGTELLDWLRHRDPELARRFVIMTGGALSGEARDALARSGVPVLEKPFSRGELVGLLNALAGV